MARVLIDCPTTGKPVPTGFTASKDTFESSQITGEEVQCPHCGQLHVWAKGDAYLEDEEA